MANVPISLGDRVRWYRSEAGLSQLELAARAGISARALRDIEQNRVANPRRVSVDRLALALGLADGSALTGTSSAGPSGDGDAGRAPRGEGELRVSVLGPFLVERGGDELPIGSPTLRRLLGLLALRHPAAIGREEIIDALWPQGPPASSRSLVHVYVAQLRRMLDPGRAVGSPSEVVVHRHGTYRLNVGAGQVDLARFDRLAEQAKNAEAAGDPELALRLVGEALRVWRGTALFDTEPGLRSHPAVVAAGERRLGAVLLQADLALQLGRGEEVVEGLRSTAVQEPLHEGVHARLMLALAGCGEQAAALMVFTELRSRLDEMLGISPGGEVRNVHLRILRQELILPERAGAAPEAAPAAAGVPPRARPAQLLAVNPVYVGRRRQLRQLDQLLGDDRGTTGRVGTVALVGPAGVGKTALALQWSHRVRQRFGDGQLFVDLRGYALAPPLHPLGVLSQFLRALGVAAEQVPTDLDEAAALYRSLLADRRMLIVLDNASSVDQVRPLLPGNENCFVLVTSRSRLAGLVAREGASRLVLDVLSADEARSLLTDLLGGSRAAADPAAVTRLARICDWLPLALRITAANLTTNPHKSIAEYCAELSVSDRLCGFAVDGDEQSAIRTTFDLSYATRPAPAQRLFRLLSLAPGPDLGVEAAAALGGLQVPEAASLLRELAEVHLVEERAGGRYGLHDLLVRYAGELASRLDREPELRAALVRLYGWYLGGVDAAAGLLYPEQLRLPLPQASLPANRTGFADHREAMAWLEVERAVLVGAVADAARRGLRETAWLLADSLRGYFALGMYTVEWQASCGTALAAAEADGCFRARAAAGLGLADLRWVQGRIESSRELYAQALELARRAEWLDGEAAALSRLGVTYKENGQPEDALACFTAAGELTSRSGRSEGQVTGLVDLGLLNWKLGRLAVAADQYRRAAELSGRLGSVSGEAVARTNLGIVQRALGRATEAGPMVEAAVLVHREVGNRVSEAVALCCLSSVYCDLGRPDRALEYARSALEIAHAVEHQRLELNAQNAIADVLDRLGDHAAAVDGYHRALRLAIPLQDRYPEVNALIGLASAELRTGSVESARAHAGRALETSRASGFRMQEGRAMTRLAALAAAGGDHEGAVTRAEEALAVHRESGHRPGEARTLLLLGDVLADRGEDAAAADARLRARQMFTEMGMTERTATDDAQV